MNNSDKKNTIINGVSSVLGSAIGATAANAMVNTENNISHIGIGLPDMDDIIDIVGPHEVMYGGPEITDDVVPLVYPDPIDIPDEPDGDEEDENVPDIVNENDYDVVMYGGPGFYDNTLIDIEPDIYGGPVDIPGDWDENDLTEV